MCIADEVPFEIPETWEWARVSSLGSIVRGSGIKRTETVESGKPCVRYGELYTTYHTSFTQAVSFVSEELFDRCKHFSFGDILMTLTGENKPDIAKAVAYLGNDEIAAGGDLAYWTAHGMNPLYLTYLMASPYVVGRKVNLATGDIIVHISGDKLGTILIPIPPLSEQQRIVDKILEAEVKLVEYTDKENSLDVLQKNFPDALKKSILQWAVQGKLVPQDPTDEPASVLLERIRAEKEQLIKAGKIKRDKHESVIFRRDNSHYEKRGSEEICIDEELPFEIPRNWEWCYLGDVAFVTKLAGFEYTKYIASNLTDTGIPLFKGKNVQNGKLVFNFEGYIPEHLSDELSRSQISKKCLLTPYVGTIGNIAIFDGSFKAHLGSNVGKIELINPVDRTYLSEEYVLNYLRSPAGYQQLTKHKKATAQESISIDAIRNVIIPIPPTNEQSRIINMLAGLERKVQAL